VISTLELFLFSSTPRRLVLPRSFGQTHRRFLMSRVSSSFEDMKRKAASSDGGGHYARRRERDHGDGSNAGGHSATGRDEGGAQLRVPSVDATKEISGPSSSPHAASAKKQRRRHKKPESSSGPGAVKQDEDLSRPTEHLSLSGKPLDLADKSTYKASVRSGRIRLEPEPKLQLRENPATSPVVRSGRIRLEPEPHAHSQDNLTTHPTVRSGRIRLVPLAPSNPKDDLGSPAVQRSGYIRLEPVTHSPLPHRTADNRLSEGAFLTTFRCDTVNIPS
jgi:hypothetical protein